jgi:drug/metabolite transporter (DMT)-like permease
VGGSGGSVAAVVAGNLIAALATLPMAAPFTGATTTDWLTVAYLGVVQIGIAYVLLTSGIRHVPAFEASILLLCEPVLNPVWSFLAHGERPGAWAIAGGVLIMAATGVRTWRTTRQLGVRPIPDSG